MASKYVKIPATIQLANMITGKPTVENIDSDGNPTDDPKLIVKQIPVMMSFRRFIISTILTDPKFGKSASDIISASEIRKIVNTTKEGETAEFEKEDWKKLMDVVNEPSNSYVPAVMIQLVEFITSIKNASDRKDVKDVKDGKGPKAKSEED